MKKISIALVAMLGVAVLWPGLALASIADITDMHWAPAAQKHGNHAAGGHNRNAAKVFALVDGAGATLTLLLPDLNHRPLAEEKGEVRVKPTGMNGYHALVAERSSGNRHETAVRYFYLHGAPVDMSPSNLTTHHKGALEIQPAPLAREHWRYLGGKEARFQLLFDGRPLPDTAITMTTGNGTSTGFTTDAKGYLSISLPDDFVDVKPGRANNRPSEFVLSASHDDGGEQFVTTFTSAYYTNPSHWQSLSNGLMVVAGGMLFGGVINWRIRRRKES